MKTFQIHQMLEEALLNRDRRLAEQAYEATRDDKIMKLHEKLALKGLCCSIIDNIDLTQLNIK